MSGSSAPPADDDMVWVEEQPTRGRRCLADRASRDPRQMLRFVVGPDDRLVFDADGRLPGRGLWLSADREAVKTALARSLFAKAARQRVRVDPDLPERLVEQVRSRCLQWLGLARRGGAIEIGFEQVERAARQGDLAVLVVARDAGNDGLSKLVRCGLPILRGFSSQEVGAALGRPPSVYVGLRPGRLAERLLADAHRLRGLCGDEPLPAAAGEEDNGAGTGPRQRG